jgi:hypothetical protein
MGDKDELAVVLANLAHAMELQGDEARAQHLFEEDLRVRRELGDVRAVPTLVALARLARKRHDREGALAFLRESLAVARPLRQSRGTVIIFDGLAAFALQDGQCVTAARLLGGAASVLSSVDFTPPRRDQPERQRTLAAVRDRLTEGAFAAAWAEGQALTPEELATQAMAVLDPLHAVL